MTAIARRASAGVVSGMVATGVLQLLMKGTAKLDPEAKAPMKKDPGDFMVSKAVLLLSPQTRAQIPEKAHKLAAAALPLGYGVTSALLYALARPRVRSVLLEGTALGVVVWAAGYLGWLPALELMPPLTKQRPKQIAAPLLQHAAFGLVVASLMKAFDRNS